MTVREDVMAYIEDIGASEVVSGRVLSIIPMLESLLLPEGEHINRAFINEYIDGNGSRNYESLWFFTNNFAMEAHEFLRRDVYDAVLFTSNVSYIRTEFSAFSPPGEPDAQSRISVNVSFGTPAGGDVGGGANFAIFKASGVNCRYLYAITREILVVNLIAP